MVDEDDGIGSGGLNKDDGIDNGNNNSSSSNINNNAENNKRSNNHDNGNTNNDNNKNGSDHIMDAENSPVTSIYSHILFIYPLY